MRHFVKVENKRDETLKKDKTFVIKNKYVLRIKIFVCILCVSCIEYII